MFTLKFTNTNISSLSLRKNRLFKGQLQMFRIRFFIFISLVKTILFAFTTFNRVDLSFRNQKIINFHKGLSRVCDYYKNGESGIQGEYTPLGFRKNIKEKTSSISPLFTSPSQSIKEIEFDDKQSHVVSAFIFYLSMYLFIYLSICFFVFFWNRIYSKYVYNLCYTSYYFT